MAHILKNVLKLYWCMGGSKEKNREYMVVKPQSAGCTTSYISVVIGCAIQT